MNKIQRPLSPHLQIYRPQITSVLSISHRITGIVLCSGAFILVIWLATIAGGKDAYEIFYSLSQHWLGKFYLFVLCYCFFYHLCNGIRHLAWDAGYGFDLATVYKSGWAVIGSSAILTLLTWLMV
ncbi:MAG: succinate dehydrogenase, cytochrome b556 subunit [Caedimonas sp.]|jgi:succinate dehydrogenase / fumarate reductase, cytochrome b subunit|nr:succinate dehydrogenase, cytochrome b556 subunit [Caedimonas sp.]